MLLPPALARKFAGEFAREEIRTQPYFMGKVICIVVPRLRRDKMRI